MKQLTKVFLAAIIPAAGVVVFVIGFCYWRRRSQPITSTTTTGPVNTSGNEKMAAGIAKSQLNNLRFQQLQRQKTSSHPPSSFDWADHPRLILEAVEHGWSRFAFPGRGSSSQSTPLRWGLCNGGGRPPEVEVNWEVPSATTEFMQTVRLRPFGSYAGGTADDSSCFSIRMNLPLPGPPLGSHSFPQDAYFEITIMHLHTPNRWFHHESKQSKNIAIESDRAKLIQEASFKALADDKDQTVKEAENNTYSSSNFVLAVGLAIEGPSTSSLLPGTYPGSIGFHSNGSIYLDGMKLVFESEKTEWTAAKRVVGCGFNPGEKKVFLTIDAKLTHVIHCHSDAYQSPLYPVFGSNAETLLLVNMGQSVFEYAPANVQRTPNPCFLRSSPEVAVSVIGSVDSRELFSMGRLDSDWYEVMMMKKSRNQSSGKRSFGNADESNADAESDLFEIPLQS